ncbi:ATP-binding protein [uncultured Mobiluncus sp.]|uniref:ATP-binding protein n=1 Tax=uncultured Mobiluncus sp. TaxID=293425 RepID=UPI0025F645E9|nr:ATP-binding protein [uncultured Mobiluncus sp.]
MITSAIPRNARVLAEEILSDTPVLTVSGARQVGKSTLVSQLLQNRSHRLLNLDNAATLQAAQTDPDGFVRQFPEGVVAIDEIQRVPALLRAIKAALDEDRRPGRFIVTGSSNLMNLKGAEESLAGRAETLRLRGFSRGERKGITEDFAANAWNPHPQLPASEFERIDYLRMITESSFPEIAEATPRRRDRWVQAYVERILTKDATDLYGIQYPDRLRVLLGKIASQGASEFVAAHIGRELNIPERSVPGYLDALKNVFLIDVLPAWGTNLTRRVISKPKVFLQDPATAASLVGVDAASLEMQISSSFTGGLLESFVATELLKQQEWSAIPFKLFHFRDSTGKEVDLVMESRNREVVGVEVKAAVSLQGKDFSGLRHLQKLTGERFRCGILLYAGKESLPMGPGLWAMPISALWSV